MDAFLANLDRRVFLLVLAWSFVWKALALWKSARKGHKWWFGAILVLNTLGLVEIVYLVLNRDKPTKSTKTKKSKTSKSTDK